MYLQECLTFALPLVLFLPFMHLRGTCATTGCDSPQYLDFGETGIISCTFHQDYYGVLWYTASDLISNVPTLRYMNKVKAGSGYESGEFDVHPDGSFIINNVSLHHNEMFSVAYIRFKGKRHEFFHVSAIVVVKPTVPFPVINHCGNMSDSCFAELKVPFIACAVIGARPNVTLELFARTLEGDTVLTTETQVKKEGIGYTFKVSTRSIFHYSDLLVLLVCKASHSREILTKNESLILVQNDAINITSTKATLKYVKRGARLEIACANNEVGFLVWKKDSLNGAEQNVLIYAIFIGEQVTYLTQSNVMLGINGSLLIPVVQVHHEGRFTCISGDGLNNDARVYDVLVVVHPVPSFPVVGGCDPHQYCVIEGGHRGSLQCTVKGIRPLVELTWKTFYDSDTAAISFSNKQLTVKDNGETFDVTVTSTYNLNDESRDRITLECTVVEKDEKFFELTTKLDLLFFKEDIAPTNPVHSPKIGNVITWVIPLIVVSLFGLLVAGFFIKKFSYAGRPTDRTKGEGEEMTSTFHANDKRNDFEEENLAEGKSLLKDIQNSVQNSFIHSGIEEMKRQFLKEVKEKYKDLYDAVQPIPYIKDRLYCVDRVFVEGGIEFYESYTGESKGVWKSLDTYQNIFNDERVQSPRRILEGEPGYGKSTVTLQFAYDWCTSKDASALKDVEIMIVLRLRQMGGVSSIYRAIKQFILPKDTLLNETDIENIMRQCTSAVVILDGFDEYPDQDDTSSSDVMNIIARKMFQNLQVVTTTRSSFLPKKYPALTKRLRLTGFDDNARRYYICKAVVGDDDEERVKNVEESLQKNPILSDLCQVPLLFVIFAHMTHESDNFRKLNSVTSFFRYMISCFHSHMRNKMADENAQKYELFESEHRDLDRAAFDALCGSSQKIVWEKDEMCKLVGQEFYEQYVRIGILVEEESVDIIDDPCTPITEHVQYKTEVRFYHKLFCEWYAAHYLSSYLQQNSDADLSGFLQYLDPFDVQYLYRFSCGLNADSAEKLINYLKQIEGGDKFAILCILEQTGQVDHIKETIRELCFEGVVISGYDSLLLQRSSMQLLDIAARNDIPIKYVILSNCLQSVDLSTASIRTTSGLALTSRIPVKVLAVTLSNREMTKDEAIDILKFASICPSLRYLWYGGCVPPRVFTDLSLLSSLKSNDVTVWWQWADKEPSYILNYHTGRWELSEDAEDRKKLTEANYKEWVKADREYLRKIAKRERRKLIGEAVDEEDNSSDGGNDDVSEEYSDTMTCENELYTGQTIKEEGGTLWLPEAEKKLCTEHTIKEKSETLWLPEAENELCTEKIINEEGGTLWLPEAEICLEIPHGAILRDYKIQVKVPLHSDLPVRRIDVLPRLTPLIICEPDGLEFLHPVKLTLPHCAVIHMPEDHTVSVSFGTKNKETNEWEWTQEDVEYVLTERLCTIFLKHFTNIKAEITSTNEKILRVIPFANLSPRKNTVALTVWFSNDIESDFHGVLQSAERDKQVPLDSYDTFRLRYSNGDEVVTVKILTVCKEWELDNSEKVIDARSLSLTNRLHDSFQLSTECKIDIETCIYLIVRIAQNVEGGPGETTFALRKRMSDLEQPFSLKGFYLPTEEEHGTFNPTEHPADACTAVLYIDPMIHCDDDVIVTLWICPFETKFKKIERLQKEQVLQQKHRILSENSRALPDTQQILTAVTKFPNESWDLIHQLKEVETDRIRYATRAKFQFIWKKKEKNEIDYIKIEVILQVKSAMTFTNEVEIQKLLYKSTFCESSDLGKGECSSLCQDGHFGKSATTSTRGKHHENSQLAKGNASVDQERAREKGDDLKYVFLAKGNASVDQERAREKGDDLKYVFLFLKSRISKKWKDIARLLGIDEEYIREIDMQYSRNISEGVYQMFLCWQEKNGSAATIDQLKNALRCVEAISTIEEIEEGKHLF